MVVEGEPLGAVVRAQPGRWPPPGGELECAPLRVRLSPGFPDPHLHQGRAALRPPGPPLRSCARAAPLRSTRPGRAQGQGKGAAGPGPAAGRAGSQPGRGGRGQRCEPQPSRRCRGERARRAAALPVGGRRLANPLAGRGAAGGAGGAPAHLRGGRHAPRRPGCLVTGERRGARPGRARGRIAVQDAGGRWRLPDSAARRRQAHPSREPPSRLAAIWARLAVVGAMTTPPAAAIPRSVTTLFWVTARSGAASSRAIAAAAETSSSPPQTRRPAGRLHGRRMRRAARQAADRAGGMKSIAVPTPARAPGGGAPGAIRRAAAAPAVTTRASSLGISGVGGIRDGSVDLAGGRPAPSARPGARADRHPGGSGHRAHRGGGALEARDPGAPGIAVLTMAAGLVAMGLAPRLLLPGGWHELAGGIDSAARRLPDRRVAVPGPR